MVLAYRLAIAAVVSTLILIAIGVVVRATGSGLGCPDWPMCHGGILPPAEKHPVIEMSHRFFAAGVGFLVIALAISCWRSFRDAPFIWVLAVAIVPMVGLQGLLGAVTVVRELPPEIVATHLLTAFVIVSALIVLTIEIHSRVVAKPPAAGPDGAFSGAAALVTIAVLGVVVWVGGYMTESGASTACPSWPGCREGSFFGGDRQELTHMAHRYGVVLLTLALAGLAAMMLRAGSPVPWSRELVAAFVLLFGVQVVVGALNVWFEFPNALAVSHTVIASLIWSVLTAVAALALRPAPAVYRRAIRQPSPG